MPDISAAEVPLINQALGMIGASTIFTLAEETNLADHVNRQWPSARDHCLAVHGWGWARKTYQLMQKTGTPVNVWAYAYSYPGGALGGPEVLYENPKNSDAPLRDFEIEENAVFSNTATLYGRFRVNPAVSLWPVLFRQAVKTLAAAFLAVPVSHDSVLAEKYRKLAIGDEREQGKGGLLAGAIAADLATRPLGSPLLRDDPLTLARWQ